MSFLIIFFLTRVRTWQNNCLPLQTNKVAQIKDERLYWLAFVRHYFSFVSTAQLTISLLYWVAPLLYAALAVHFVHPKAFKSKDLPLSLLSELQQPGFKPAQVSCQVFTSYWYASGIVNIEGALRATRAPWGCQQGDKVRQEPSSCRGRGSSSRGWEGVSRLDRCWFWQIGERLFRSSGTN